MRHGLGNAPLDIGGWLILMGIRLIGGISNNGNSAIQTFSLHPNAITQPVAILLIFAILYAFYVLILFFKRHKAFPVAFIVLEALTILYNLSIFFISSKPAIDFWDLSWLSHAIVFPLISALWILYTLLSKRVKKTFVLKWDRTADQQLVDKANAFHAVKR